MKKTHYSLILGLLCGSSLMAQEQAAPKLPDPPQAEAQQNAPATAPKQEKAKNKLAGEVTLDKAPFDQTFTPKSLAPLKIKDPVETGTVVKKGQPLFTVERDAITDAITASQTDLENKQLELEKAQFTMEQGTLSGQRNIINAERNFKRQQEDHDSYMKTFLPQSIKEADMALKRSEENVAYKKENLRQLTRMYKEDQITEESEEIILTRTKNELDAAEKGLEAAKITHDWAKNVRIPRETEDRVTNLENAKTSLDNLKKQVSFELRAKALALKDAVKKQADAAKKLAELSEDNGKLNFNAEEDGILVWCQAPTSGQTPTRVVYLILPQDLSVSAKIQELYNDKTPLAVGDQVSVKVKSGQAVARIYPTVKSVEGDKITVSFEEIVKNARK